jgi:hypothetical protein
VGIDDREKWRGEEGPQAMKSCWRIAELVVVTPQQTACPKTAPTVRDFAQHHVPARPAN